ncbi:hypothetical protein V6N13_039379 [Hibiscus sabdariffa]
MNSNLNLDTDVAISGDQIEIETRLVGNLSWAERVDCLKANFSIVLDEIRGDVTAKVCDEGPLQNEGSMLDLSELQSETIFKRHNRLAAGKASYVVDSDSQGFMYVLKEEKMVSF